MENEGTHSSCFDISQEFVLDTNNLFQKSLPYSLLSDPERVLIAVLTGSSAKTPRSHFVFANGKLADKKLPVKPADRYYGTALLPLKLELTATF